MIKPNSKRQSITPHPRAFEGPHAIVSGQLWLMVWDNKEQDRETRQWLVLADEGEAGPETLREAGGGVDRILFAVSLTQLRMTLASLPENEKRGLIEGGSLLPGWLPQLSWQHVVLFEQDGLVEAKISRGWSADRAMEDVYQEQAGRRIIACATKREVADVISTLEEILTTQDTSPILSDFRSVGDRDPMWLERARSDYFDRILGELGE